MKLKYLNTVLRYYRALTLTPCYLLATWSRPASTWHDSCVITHAQHLSHQRQGPDTKRKCPRTTLLQYLTPSLIIPAPIITSRTSELPVLSTAPVRLPGYISFLLFIASTFIRPLTISFCAHHVTMKDAGFKLPSLQHPPSQLAFSNQ